MNLVTLFQGERLRGGLMVLDRVVKRYIAIREENNFNSYTHFEVLKLEVADAFLEAIGLETTIEWREPRRANTAPRAPKPPNIGFVYLMKNKRNGYTKIGFSSNPKAREATLQAEEPEIDLLHKKPDTTSDEVALHIRYAHKMVRGEWCQLTEEDIKVIGRGLT